MKPIDLLNEISTQVFGVNAGIQRGFVQNVVIQKEFFSKIAADSLAVLLDFPVTILCHGVPIDLALSVSASGINACF